MTEPAPEPYAPQSAHRPVDPDRDVTGRNNRFALALFGLAILLFGGTFAVGLIYLALD